MNEVFERFVGRYLQEHFLHDKTTEVVLQDPIWLDAERQEKGIPDIVIRRTDGTTTVLDTKYKFFKGNPDPRDRDQMWIYSQRIKAREGILIYPDSRHSIKPPLKVFHCVPLPYRWMVTWQRFESTAVNLLHS